MKADIIVDIMQCIHRQEPIIKRWKEIAKEIGSERLFIYAEMYEAGNQRIIKKLRSA